LFLLLAVVTQKRFNTCDVEVRHINRKLSGSNDGFAVNFLEQERWF